MFTWAFNVKLYVQFHHPYNMVHMWII